MTVKEVREMLLNFPQNAIVAVRDRDGDIVVCEDIKAKSMYLSKWGELLPCYRASGTEVQVVVITEEQQP